MNLFLNEIFNVVKSDFCTLVDYKVRGETIEIITAIPTLSNSYVSVFISQKNDKFIVSDGGWLFNNMYGSRHIEDTELFERIFIQYLTHFQILQTKSKDGITYNYKTTKKLELVSAMVFDVGHFVSAISNAQNISYKEVSEIEDRAIFHNSLNSFFKSQYGANKVDINEAVKISEKNTVKVNAVLRVNPRNNYYLMYVTGSRSNYFIKDIAETTINFEIIKANSISNQYYKCMALINAEASGFDHDKAAVYIERLAEVTDFAPIELVLNRDMNNLKSVLPISVTEMLE